MSIVQSLLPEFDQEMATTRRLLERVPEADAAWKPHTKSMSLGDVAAHIANLLTWVGWTMRVTVLDVNPPGGEPVRNPGFKSTAELLERFDENVKQARAAMAPATDEELRVIWTLKSGGTTVVSFPRSVALRSFVLNHLIHHRGQLSVYLRLRDVQLPSIYGPTADS